MVSHLFYFLSHRHRLHSDHSLPMKRKRKSSPENLPLAKFFRNPMRRRKITSLKSSHQLVEEETCSYLPDDCWEIVFRFLIINDNDRRCLNSLSLVSKQFLSLTNRLLFSLTVFHETCPSLRLRLFKRFTHLNSLNLSRYKFGLNKLLRELGNYFPLNITSLNISNNMTFPAHGLRYFSQNVSTLTSLNASNIHFLKSSHLLLIANCFPLLKQLNLGKTLSNNHTYAIHYLSSKCRIQQLDLDRNYFLENKHIAQLSFFLADLVSINLSLCCKLTKSSLFLLVRNCPSLSDIKMVRTNIGEEILENNDSLSDIGVYPQLKSLYLGDNSWLNDENLVMFASSFPNLQLLDLNYCHHISESIFQVLRKCCKITHLNLAGCSEADLFEMNFIVPKLEVLNLSNTRVNDETLFMISKSCSGLLELFLENCCYVTEKGVKHVVENCKQLKKIYLGDFHISDKNRELFLCHGCLIC